MVLFEQMLKQINETKAFFFRNFPSDDCHAALPIAFLNPKTERGDFFWIDGLRWGLDNRTQYCWALQHHLFLDTASFFISAMCLKQKGKRSFSSYLWKLTHSQHLPCLLHVLVGQLQRSAYMLDSHDIINPQQQHFLVLFVSSFPYFKDLLSKNFERFSGIR